MCNFQFLMTLDSFFYNAIWLYHSGKEVTSALISLIAGCVLCALSLDRRECAVESEVQKQGCLESILCFQDALSALES